MPHLRLLLIALLAALFDPAGPTMVPHVAAQTAFEACPSSPVITGIAVIENCQLVGTIVITPSSAVHLIFRNVSFADADALVINGMTNHSRIEITEGSTLANAVRLTFPDNAGYNVTVVLRDVTLAMGAFVWLQSRWLRSVSVVGDVLRMGSYHVVCLGDVGTTHLQDVDVSLRSLRGVSRLSNSTAPSVRLVDTSFVTLESPRLINCSIAIRDVSWDATGAPRNFGMVSFLVLEILGRVSVNLVNVSASVQFQSPGSVSLIRFVPDSIDAEIAIDVDTANVLLISTVDAASHETTETAIIRFDRVESANFLALRGSIAVHAANVVARLTSSMRTAFLDFHFARGHDVVIIVKIARCRVTGLVQGSSDSITPRNVAAYAAQVGSGGENVHRESGLVSAGVFQSCRAMNITVEHTDFTSTVFVDANIPPPSTGLFEFSFSPWLFALSSLVTVSNTTNLTVVVRHARVDSTIACHRQPGGDGSVPVSEQVLAHGSLVTVLQVVSTDPMELLHMSVTNVTSRFAINTSVGAWDPSVRSSVAFSLDASPTSIGAAGACYNLVSLDILCCGSKGAFQIAVTNVTTGIAIADRSATNLTQSGGGVWVALVTVSPIATRMRSVGLTLSIIQQALAEGFGSPTGRLNELEYANVTIRNVVADVSESSGWLSLLLAVPLVANAFSSALQFTDVLVKPPALHATPTDSAFTSTFVVENTTTVFSLRTVGAAACGLASVSPGLPRGPAAVAVLLNVQITTPILIAVTHHTVLHADAASHPDVVLPLNAVFLFNTSMRISQAGGAATGNHTTIAVQGVVLSNVGAGVAAACAPASTPPPWRLVEVLRPSTPASTAVVLDTVWEIAHNTLATPPASVSSGSESAATCFPHPSSLALDWDGADAGGGGTGGMPSHVRIWCNRWNGGRLPDAALNVPRHAVTVAPPTTTATMGAQCAAFLNEATTTATIPIRMANEEGPIASAVSALSGVTTGAVGVASIASSAAGAMVSASSVLRLQASLSALRMRQRCADDDGSIADGDDDGGRDGVDFIGSAVSDNPTRARVDALGVRSAYAGGAVLTNAALVVAVAFASAAVGSLLGADDTKGGGVAAQAGRKTWCINVVVRLPGRAAAPFAALLQPSIAASLLCILVAVPAHDHVAGNAALRVFVGVVGCALYGGYFAGIVWRVLWHFPLRAQRAPTSPYGSDRDANADHHRIGGGNDSCHGDALGCAHALLDPHDVWVSAPSSHMARRHHMAYRQRYHLVYECYRRDCHWTVAVEWASAVLLGLFDALSAAAPGGGGQLCEAAVWCSLAVNVALFGFAIWRRPYNTHLDNAVNGLQCSATVAVVVLAVCGADVPAAYLALVQGVLTLLSMVLGGTWAVAQRMARYVASRRLVFSQQSTATSAAGGGVGARRILRRDPSGRHIVLRSLTDAPNHTNVAHNGNTPHRFQGRRLSAQQETEAMSALLGSCNGQPLLTRREPALRTLVQMICEQQRWT